MKKIGIVKMSHRYDKDFDEKLFKIKDSRIMDRFTKLFVSTALDLFHEKDEASVQIPYEIGVVLATATGPYESIKELHSIMKDYGYLRINPSLFPNTMLSTALARVAIALQAKGPTVSMYLSHDRSAAIRYASMQIAKDRCERMIVLYGNEGDRYFGILLESEESAANRDEEIRLYI